MNKKAIAVISALLIAVTLTFGAGCGKSDAPETTDANTAAQTDAAAQPDDQTDAPQEDAAPDFTATLTNGDTFTLSDHKDEVVMLNFWATWCSPCVGELPEIQRLVDENIEGFTFLAIDCAEAKSTVDKFLQENGYTFSVAYDEDMAIESLYPTDGIPYTVLIKNGVVEKTFLGRPEDPYTEYKTAVEELLAK